MKTERVRAVRRSCRKDSSERAAPVRARIDLKHITSCSVQPSDDNDLVTNRQADQTLNRRRVEFHPSVGCTLRTLFGRIASLLVIGSDHTDRPKLESPASPAMRPVLHTLWFLKCASPALRPRSCKHGSRFFPNKSSSSQRSSSFFEDRQVKLLKTHWVAHDINLGYLPVVERKFEHPQQPSTRSENESYRSINEHGLRESGTS
jgi:hypothetical protein